MSQVSKLQQQLGQLAQAHPGIHPYSLALKLQVINGKIITGQLAKQILMELSGSKP